MSTDSSRQLVEHFFRHESSRLVAALVRTFGVARLGQVEDAVQGALVRAMSSWALRGTPDDPAAWLYRAARNLIIDGLRRDLRWSPMPVPDHPASSSAASADDSLPEADELYDAQLRMIFVCCDESIPEESQIAFALKTLCGFGVSEIARALVTTEIGITKRITRAKERLRSAGIDPGRLTPEMIGRRTGRVLSVIYLLFNEGYGSSSGERLIREELCAEAIRLALLLAEHSLTAGPETAAFTALLMFHAARLGARTDDNDSLLLLSEQDRSRWDLRLMAEGFRWFGRSAGGDKFTRFHAEAWIAAEHCRAGSYEQTDWNRILTAYEYLIRIAPSPIHELNRAIAVAERFGADAGWESLQKIAGTELESKYYLWNATAGELARRRGRMTESADYLARAAELAPSEAERRLIHRRLQEVRELLESSDQVE